MIIVNMADEDPRVVHGSVVLIESLLLFVCLFVEIKPDILYSASCVRREVNPLGVITHGQRYTPRAYQ